MTQDSEMMISAGNFPPNISSIPEADRDIIVACDPAGRVTYASPCCHRLDYSPQDLVGLMIADLVHPEDLDRWTANTQSLWSRGVLPIFANRRHRFRRGDGGWVVLEGDPVLARTDATEAMGVVTRFREPPSRALQETLFENAFYHAPIGIALVSLEGRFLKVNKALAAIVGYDVADLLELDFQAITHPDDLDADLSLLGQLLAGEIPSYQMVKRYRRADLQHVWVELSVSMVRDADGRPAHFISQIQDLTEQRRTETLYRLMAHNVRDIIVTSDGEGRTLFATPSSRSILGYEPDELVGRLPLDQTHPDDRAGLTRAFNEVARGGQSSPVRWRARHKTEDRWVWLESKPSRLDSEPGESQPHFLDVIRDVTAQVAQETALADAIEAAEAAAAVKAEFLANMSHEIRTPLTAILGFSTLLAGRRDLDDAAAAYADRVATASRGLLTLVNDILDFSKLEAGQIIVKPTATDVRSLCAEVLSLFVLDADSKDLELRATYRGALPDAVLVDADRLRQILLNLLGNALKFTAVGHVELAIRYSVRTQTLTLAIKDTGSGMSPAQTQRLFQRFSQVDGSSTRQHGGTGLGLAICKGLTEAMGGRISLRTAPDQGSTFSVRLPAPSIAALAAHGAVAQPYDLAGARVLVVDDNAANRELVRAVLSPFGVEVHEAVDGQDGVNQGLSLPFDLILMDIRMPGLDGPSAAARIRAEAGPNASIPILAFSADLSREDAGGAAFDGVVAKPLDARQLLQSISAVLHDQEGPQDRAVMQG